MDSSHSKSGMSRIRNRRFAAFAWGVLAYNILVVLWGAYTRATGSGAGCGSHWPLCNGEVVPRDPQIETIIEFAHRTTSALAGVLVIILLVWAWRAFPKGHLVRRGSVLSLIFIIIEGLVGASLVRYEWVAGNDSVARAVIMAVHLVNTFILLGVITMTAWWASTIEADDTRPRSYLRRDDSRSWLIGVALLLIVIVSAAGAVTALGDTLFPAGSLREGVARDFSPTAHFLERLRVWHPVLAVLSALYIFAMLGKLGETRAASQARRFSRAVQLLVATQIAAGAVNLLLLAPIVMQIVHLLLADLVWISLVLLAATALEETAPVALRERAAATA